MFGGVHVSFRIVGLQRLQPFDMGNGCFIPGVCFFTPERLLMVQKSQTTNHMGWC